VLESRGDPFLVAEVCSNNTASATMTVHWWVPTPLSRKKTNQYHSMIFEPEMNKTRIVHRQRGGPMFKLSPRLDTIKYNCIYFGFSRIHRDGRLAPSVQRKLRSQGIIDKNIKLKRL